MSVYFDASVLVSLFVKDHFTDRAEAFVRGAAPSVCVSDFAAAEVCSAIGRLIRMNALTMSEGRVVLADFDAWRIRGTRRLETNGADVALAESFLRRLDLPLRTPDALQLALSVRAAAPMATFDVGMLRSAQTLGLPVAEI